MAELQVCTYDCLYQVVYNMRIANSQITACLLSFKPVLHYNLQIATSLLMF
jgi:hypothetical protein